MKGRHECFCVFCFHEGFADQDRVGTAFAGAGGIFNVKDPTFANLDDVVRDLRYQGFGYSQVGFESL